MIHSIKHQTILDYVTTPTSVVQRLHLTPPNLSSQRVAKWDIIVEGGAIVMEAVDYHGNKVHLCKHDAHATRMQITCLGQVDVSDTHGIVGEHDNGLPLDLFKNSTHLSLPGPRLRQLSKEIERFESERLINSKEKYVKSQLEDVVVISEVDS